MPDHLIDIIAYSYIRFSSPEQSKGDSLRRQEQLAEDYCRRRGWTLDTSLSLRDLGVSAFRGKNALVGNLGVFLAAIKRGTVLPGSVLIVENVDRISRQGIDEGYDIVKSILKAGVHIVTLSPEREFGPEAVKSLTKGALELQLILERAADESERKSQRVGAAWGQKKKRAREGVVMSSRLPAWVKREGDRLVLIPDAVAALHRIFELSAAGYGVISITGKLNADGVPPIGRSGRWTRGYLNIILKDRRVLGEYQPRRGKDSDGEVIADYYPRVVSDEQWYAARAGASQRGKYRGRIGKAKVNIFAGLLKHARDGDSYMMTTRTSKSPRTRDGKPGKSRTFPVLVNSASEQGQGRSYSIPYDVIETAVLDQLVELDPHEILNGDRPPDETTARRAELDATEAELAEAVAFMDANGFSATIGKRIKDLETRQRDLVAQLAEARQKAAHPQSETWGEVKTLAGVLATATDKNDCRLRLRAGLRRIIDTVLMLIVPHAQVRLIALQLWFAGSKRQRSYLLLWSPASGPKPASLSVISFARELATLDLRRPESVAVMVQALEALDLTTLDKPG